MSIVFKLLDDGAFVVGDTKTRRTDYACPSSTLARMARMEPYKIGSEMIRIENSIGTVIASRDKRNWGLLGGEVTGIVFKLLDNGAFVVGDIETRLSAYVSSPSAEWDRKEPGKIAKIYANNDKNWELLEWEKS
jgi:hypothetical protein